MIPPDRVDPDPNDPLAAREQEVLAELADGDLEAPLTVQLTEQNGIPIVRLSGELEMATGDVFRHHTAALLAGHPASLVVDLSGLSYIDSHGLGLLLRAARQVTGRLAVVTPHDRIARLFRATGLDGTMPVFPTLAEALTRCAP